MTSNEVIQEVIDKTDMVELVGEFVSLEKNGANYRGLCPFHNENTPSFMVSPQKHLATCFGCHKSLNPIQFVQEIKNISFPEALKYVADKAGVKVDVNIKKSEGPDYSKYYSMLATSQSFYYKNLNETENGNEALDYLSKRGLGSEVIEKFGIGLADEKPDIIYQIYKKLGYLELDMQSTGMVSVSEGGKYHDIFTRRIMFPIYDEHNNLVGYSGRVYRTQDKDQPKYINSPESVVFKKRNVLYNINNAYSEARRKKRFILCEGQMDVIACDRAGFGEAVCSMGTGLTEEHAKLMKKFAKEVVVMYDNDHAGIEASIKAINLLRNSGLEVSLVHLNGVKDADEMVLKKGPDALKDYVNDNIATVNEYLFEISTQNKNFEKEAEFKKTKDFIFNFLKDESNSIVERYLTRLSEISDVSYEALVNDFNAATKRKVAYIKNKRGKYDDPKIVEANYSENIKYEDKYKRVARRLFGYAIKDKKYAMYIDQNIDVTGFDTIHRDIWMEIIDNYYQYKNEFDYKSFGTLVMDNPSLYDQFKNDVNILSKDVIEEYNEEDMMLCIDTFNESIKLKQIEEYTAKLKSETSSEGKKYFMNKIVELRKQIKK